MPLTSHAATALTGLLALLHTVLFKTQTFIKLRN